MMSLRLVSALLLSASLRCHGFQPHSMLLQRHQTASPSCKLFVSSGILPEDDTCVALDDGPSSVFGKPLDDETRKNNKELVKMTKQVIFDTLFHGKEMSRCYARFYALETIARMPYFSYLTVLHLYESLGWWRKAEYLKVHFSESYNEQHHLLIMEEIGGSDRWVDRFIAQHIAVGYYWMVIALYMYNPTLAYNFNQAVEEEAYETYSEFVKSNESYLETQPVPSVAKKYYAGDDLYLFDAMHFDEQNSREVRRPKMESLYDAFVAVRDDELEHVKTMVYLQGDSCK